MDLLDGILSKGEYDDVKERYLQERDALLEEEKTAENQCAQRKEAALTAYQWLNRLKQYRRVPVIDKELVDLLIDKILIYGGNRIQVKLNYSDPFNAFSTVLSKEVPTDGE